jgi:hypothetical protein
MPIILIYLAIPIFLFYNLMDYINPSDSLKNYLNMNLYSQHICKVH